MALKVTHGKNGMYSHGVSGRKKIGVGGLFGFGRKKTKKSTFSTPGYTYSNSSDSSGAYSPKGCCGCLSFIIVLIGIIIWMGFSKCSGPFYHRKPQHSREYYTKPKHVYNNTPNTFKYYFQLDVSASLC